MKTKWLFLSAIAAMLMTGCVSNKKYAALEAEHKALEKEYNATKLDLTQCKTSSESLQEMLRQTKSDNADLKEAYAAAQNALQQSVTQSGANISKLVDEINSSNKYIRQLVSAKSKSDSLNLILTTNLTRSLSPEDMKDVNVKVLKGVVYISLADNMLYKSGSYQVNDQAMGVLGKIANIIKDYKDYDVLVEGNTDNVPINRTNIRNNWDLSALRASSVVQVLIDKFGVDPSRLTAGGRGEFNPVADNLTESGRSRNRRTEIIITPKLDQFMELIDKAPETTK